MIVGAVVGSTGCGGACVVHPLTSTQRTRAQPKRTVNFFIVVNTCLILFKPYLPFGIFWRALFKKNSRAGEQFLLVRIKKHIVSEARKPGHTDFFWEAYPATPPSYIFADHAAAAVLFNKR